MQKAIIIKDTVRGSSLLAPSAASLNALLDSGWRFVTAVPFGVSTAVGGQGGVERADAALLVIVERDTAKKGVRAKR